MQKNFLDLITNNPNSVIVSETEIDPKSEKKNRIFVLIVEGGSEAGGRAGGFGSRKVSKVYEFILQNGIFQLVFEIEGEKASMFEVPYFVSRIPIRLPGNSEITAYCAIDEETVKRFESLVDNS